MRHEKNLSSPTTVSNTCQVALIKPKFWTNYYILYLFFSMLCRSNSNMFKASWTYLTCPSFLKNVEIIRPLERQPANFLAITIFTNRGIEKKLWPGSHFTQYHISSHTTVTLCLWSSSQWEIKAPGIIILFKSWKEEKLSFIEKLYVKKAHCTNFM